MKKILLSLAFIAFAFAANAQLVISANIGGNYSFGSTTTEQHITVPTDSTSTISLGNPTDMNITGGFSLGYKFGRGQIGLAASFTHAATTTFFQFSNLLAVGENWEKVTTNSFSVAPYFRYNVIEMGDLALFAQVSLYYASVLDPEAQRFFDYKIGEDHFTYDTTYNTGSTVTSLGAQIIPGVTWTINKYMSLDLYFDIASVAFASTTAKQVTVTKTPHTTFDDDGVAHVTYDIETTTVTNKGTQVGVGITGSPLLTTLHSNNWVRVGFNWTF